MPISDLKHVYQNSITKLRVLMIYDIFRVHKQGEAIIKSDPWLGLLYRG
jgi:hypothetical protein